MERVLARASGGAWRWRGLTDGRQQGLDRHIAGAALLVGREPGQRPGLDPRRGHERRPRRGEPCAPTWQREVQSVSSTSARGARRAQRAGRCAVRPLAQSGARAARGICAPMPACPGAKAGGCLHCPASRPSAPRTQGERCTGTVRTHVPGLSFLGSATVHVVKRSRETRLSLLPGVYSV